MFSSFSSPSCHSALLVVLFLLLQTLPLQALPSNNNNNRTLPPPPIAHTLNGTYRGQYLPSFDQDLFLGIPYANAPRLSPPSSLNSSWPGIHDASAYGPTCYGFGSNTLLNLTQSEDCLSLNIIRPHFPLENGTITSSSRPNTNTSTPLLPVLLWIYGGGFRQGASADPMWNLSYIVSASTAQRQPLLAISINYRLSFLGFPAGAEAAAAGILNLGLKDQRLALRWVQENVAAFGGDPRRVTIWGESGGSLSVADQMLAYGGRGGAQLFHQAILVSGFATGVRPGPPTANQAGYDMIVERAGCGGASSGGGTVACLRAAPLEAIYPFEDGIAGAAWAPVLDGAFLRRPAVEELAAGDVARVPILLGSNSDEGLFIANLANTTVADDATLAALLRATLAGTSNATVDGLLARYPAGDHPAPPYVLPPDFAWCEALATLNLHLNCGPQYRRFAAITGDWLAHASRRYLAERWARLGLLAYSFRFDTDPTALDPLRYWVGLGPGFATHGAELAYEFGLPPGFTTSIDFYPPVRDVPAHAALSRAMVSKWVAFAYAGDPNAVAVEGVPSWPVYWEGGVGRNMVFNATVGGLHVHVEADDYREEGIAFINAQVDVI